MGIHGVAQGVAGGVLRITGVPGVPGVPGAGQAACSFLLLCNESSILMNKAKALVKSQVKQNNLNLNKQS